MAFATVSNHGKIIMVCRKVPSVSFFTQAQMQIKKQRISPQSSAKAVQYDKLMLRNVLGFNILFWECMMCQTPKISKSLLLMIQFDLRFTFQLIRIRVDFRNWTSEHRILFPQGVFPEYVIHKIPVHGEIKGGREKEAQSVAWGKEEEGRVWHRSAFQLHCLPSCACDRGGSENLSFAPQQRQGEECSWGD